MAKTSQYWPERTRLLLVEDYDVNQTVVKNLLQRLGLQVDIASNGLEALNILEKALSSQPYTLVFMDCLMPVMDGYEATHRIRQGLAGEGNRNIVIIAMTANGTKRDEEKCIAAGMNDYLAKPLSSRALDDMLNKWLIKQVDRLHTSAREASSHDGVFIFDKSVLLECLGGNRDVAVEVCQVFIQDFPSDIRVLQESLKAGDVASVEFHAHGMKGAAANLGGKALSRAAFEVEKAAKERDMNSVQGRLVELENQFAHLKAAIESWL